MAAMPAASSLLATSGPFFVSFDHPRRFLAVTGTTFRSGSILNGIAAYLAYALGMALLVGVLATAIALAAAPVTTWLRSATRYLTRLGGVLLIATSIYVIYYGIYELRVARGANTGDSIIDGAGRLQREVSSWVGAVGVVPIAAVLAAVVAVVVVAGRRRALRRTRPPADADTAGSAISPVQP